MPANEASARCLSKAGGIMSVRDGEAIVVNGISSRKPVVINNRHHGNRGRDDGGVIQLGGRRKEIVMARPGDR